MESAAGSRKTVLVPALKLTVGIWIATFGLFLAPQLASLGYIRPFSASLMAIEIAVGALLSAILYLIAQRVRDSASWVRLACVTAGVCAAALSFSLFDAWFSGLILKLFMGAHRIPEDVVNMTVSNFISFSWLYGMLGAVYVILQTNEAVRERDRQLAEAQALMQTAQLTALRLQLNPHFLFNTLNAVSALIVTGRSRQGEAMLSKLCDFLRTALTTDAAGMIPLGEELHMLQNYLEIEGIRFGDRLTVQFDCADALLELPLPSFILQPLVENAVKYAVAPTSRPIIIRVAARVRGESLVVTVDDNGGSVLPPAAAGTGVGLANVRRRLEVIYGDAARLETSAHANGFMAMIRLPVTEAAAAADRSGLVLVA